MMQLTRHGLAVSPDVNLAELRTQFTQQHYLQFSNFLSPDILAFALKGIQKADFQSRSHSDLALELCMEENLILHFLMFLVNHKTVFEWMETLTGCQAIGSFVGRVYRMAPGDEHYHVWHNDCVETRMLAISINLSEQIFAGGLFQLKQAQTDEMLANIANTGLGDIVIFRIADDLKHRVTPVFGTVPKTVFTGWFQQQPCYFKDLLTRPTAIS
jgi:hypothetical protein